LEVTARELQDHAAKMQGTLEAPLALWQAPLLEGRPVLEVLQEVPEVPALPELPELEALEAPLAPLQAPMQENAKVDFLEGQVAAAREHRHGHHERLATERDATNQDPRPELRQTVCLAAETVPDRCRFTGPMNEVNLEKLPMQEVYLEMNEVHEINLENLPMQEVNSEMNEVNLEMNDIKAEINEFKVPDLEMKEINWEMNELEGHIEELEVPMPAMPPLRLQGELPPAMCALTSRPGATTACSTSWSS